jgi:hypothetical protein
MAPVVDESWDTPVVCKNGHRDRVRVVWSLLTIEVQDRPIQQMPKEIHEMCPCGAPFEIADGWTPYPPAR